MKDKEFYDGLVDYATTDHQRNVLKACAEHGEQKAAAEALSMDFRRVNKIVKKLEHRAAKAGWSPDHDVVHGAPPGYMMRGTSTLYNGAGDVVMQWHKTKEDIYAQWLALESAVHDLFKDVPRAEPRPLKDRRIHKSIDELLALYPEGDPHWGMRVWDKETGKESYDLTIAMSEYKAATDYLIDVAPAAATAVLLNVGDNFHADNPENQTRRSGNSLQVDGRLSKVFSTVIEARRYRIDRALDKHDKVVVREVVGNHDEVLAMGFTHALKGYYHDEPRVVVEDTPNEFWYYQFGKVLLGATHGHKVKIQDLPLLMACDVPEMWGSTLHRHCYTGHRHHMERLEMKGVVAEMLRTLAPRNEYENSHGYRSTRDMMVRTFHKEYGEVSSSRLSYELLKELLK